MTTLSIALPVRTRTQVAPKRTPSFLLPQGFAAVPQPVRIRMHQSWDKLADHVARHILSDEARPALRAAFPDLTNLDEFDSEKHAVRWMRRDPNSDLGHDDPVVMAYASIVERSVLEASSLDLLTWTTSTCITLDSAGFIVVIDKGAVRTAFVPAIERSSSVQDRVLRSSRREDRARKQLAEERDGDERYFYEVFRPAIQHLRRFPVENRLGQAEYGSLKSVLPPQSQLDFLNWVSMRRQCNHGGMEFGL